MNVDPGFKDIKKFRGLVKWFKMESSDFYSNNRLKLKSEIGNIVSFNGQPITFRLSIKEIEIFESL